MSQSDSSNSSIILNASQLEAVNHFRGPMLVLAGPGSGKTAVIVTRIKSLIENHHVLPQNILAITFSKACAAEMQERFARMNRSVFLQGNAYFPTDRACHYSSVKFSTLHALCLDILKNTGRYRDSNIITGSRRLHIIKENITLLLPEASKKSAAAKPSPGALKEPAVAKPSPDALKEPDIAKLLSDEISRFKNLGVSTDFKLSESVPDNIKPLFTTVFRMYEDQKNENGFLDFDDMLLFAFEILRENRELLLTIRQKYKYILADEFQDINPLQYNIIKLLSGSRGNIFAVGDDDQSIYGFRGAVPGIMKNFPKDFRDTKILTLNINYRCPPEIIDSSARLISFNKNRFKKKITAAKKSGCDTSSDNSFFIKRFPDSSAECDHICDDLKAALKNGTDISNTAVLFRSSYEAFPLTITLKKNNIPFVSKDMISNPFNHFTAEDMIAYIRAAEALYGKDEHLKEADLLSDLLKIINKPVRYISRASLRGEPGTPYTSGVRDTSDAPGVQGTKVEPVRQGLKGCRMYYKNMPYMLERINKLEEDLRFITGCTPFSAIKYIRYAVGYDGYLKEFAKEKNISFSELENIISLLECSASGFGTFDKWLAFINKYSEDPSGYMSASNTKGVHIMTMHASKGLEFDNVYIPRLNKGSIPHPKAVSASGIEEERRLLYVAMTRAKKKLIISYPVNINGKACEPSPFLDNILPPF